MSEYGGFECDGCGWETPRAMYRDGQRLCPDCHGGDGDRSAGSRHQSYTSKRKFGKSLSYAEAMQIMTNKKREDGKYRPDPRWR